MSIITNQSPDPWIKKVDKKEKLKEEIRGEVISEMKKKKHKKIFTCCFLKLLIVILILGGIATIVAKTGIVDIPVFSKLFYKTPTPERIVSANIDKEKSFENILAQKLEQQIESGKKSETDGQKIEIALDFTEEELTGFLKNAEATENFPFSYSQISISPDGLEVFGQLKELNKTFLTIILKPEVTEGNLKISFKEIKIGNLSLPPAIGNFLVDKFLKDQINSTQETISKNGKLENIELADGKIVLHGLIDVASLLE